MISEKACSVPGTPKDIGAGWTDDRRAGVLGDHQSIKRDALLAGKWQVGLDEKWRAVHMQRVVDGDRASRGSSGTPWAPTACRFMRCALSVLRRTVIRQPDDPEKYEGPVLA